jgi:flagellar motor switch protein FliN
VKQDVNVQETKSADTSALVSISTDLLKGVKVSLEASLGRSEIRVEEMMALEKGSVVTLETGLADHVDLFLNDALIARGEIVAVGDKYGVRIVEIARAR